MSSNVFTKNEILQNLASRGYFIDIYTLDAFFEKRKVEAIFEDESGNEFYDKNSLDIVLDGLFGAQQNQAPSISVEPVLNTEPILNQEPNITTPVPEIPTEPINITSAPAQDLKIDDSETFDILNNISLSDGSPLIDKVQDTSNAQIKPDYIEQNTNMQEQEVKPNILEETINLSMPQGDTKFDFNNIQNDLISPKATTAPFEFQSEPPLNIQGGENFAAQNSPEDVFSPSNTPDIFEPKADDIMVPDPDSDVDDVSDFDDITLLSESLEAQEKLRQYVVSELSKKNLDVTPKSNEFKLDISERTLTMIARTMAKKIAKYVGTIIAQDAKQSSKAAQFQEENRRLTQKARELEEQNRKLRLLLAESNKNLNSYKPSIFGLYKKVDPKTNKK
ncbi:hypothetical protein IJ531_04085 [bacterium]|nr:hypothetical protein [bacterium]